MDEENKNKIIQNWSNINPKDLKSRLDKFLDGLHRALLFKKFSNGFRNAADFISDVLYFGPIFRKPDIIKKIKPGTIFYRARCIRNNHKTCTIKNYNDKEVLDIVKHKWTEWSMWEPPLGLPSMGRLNMKGEPFLYLSCNKNVTLDEIRANPNDYVAISKFVVKRPIVVDCIGFHSIVNWLKDESITNKNVINIGKLYDCFFTKAFTQKIRKDGSDKWKYYLSIVLSHEYFNSTVDPEKVHAWKYPSMQTSDNKIYNICVKPEWAHRDLEMVNTQLGVAKRYNRDHLIFQELDNITFQNTPEFNFKKNSKWTDISNSDIIYSLIFNIEKCIDIINQFKLFINDYKYKLKFSNLSLSDIDKLKSRINNYIIYIRSERASLSKVKEMYINSTSNHRKAKMYILQMLHRIKYIHKLIIINQWALNYVIDNYGNIISIASNATKKPVNQFIDANGYSEVKLMGKNGIKLFRVDRLVMNSFVRPLKSTDVVVHINSKLDNCLYNLRIK